MVHQHRDDLRSLKTSQEISGSEDTLDINVGSWNIKTADRKRNRMKITIKLNKEESESFKAFFETVKPTDVSDDQFLKTIFFYGIEAVNERLTETVKEYLETHREELEASGVSLETSGSVAELAGVEVVEFDNEEE